MSMDGRGYFVNPDAARKLLGEMLGELDVLDRVLADDQHTATPPMGVAARDGEQTTDDQRKKISAIQQAASTEMRSAVERLLLATRNYKEGDAAGADRIGR